MVPFYNIIVGNAKGILKMSLVEDAAVCSDFIAFSKQASLKFSVDEEQHIVFGVALRADFPIYRMSADKGEFYVVFTKEAIRDMYEKFMREGANNVNLNHSIDTDGCYIIQSFIKDSAKGINPTGFEDIKDGSWFVAYKIENEEVWQKVKSGEFNGFSVEGTFQLEDIDVPTDEIDDYVQSLLN